MTAATFALSMPAPQPKLNLIDPGKPPISMTEKHRPATLADVVGQGIVTFRIGAFLEAPYSTAMLFEGPTGVGKTTIAKAIAAELGAVEFGGLEEIKSGMQDAEAVETVLRTLRFTPMLGSGWKVVIVDEADYMSPKAAQLWLSALEDLPPQSVIIFTTNHASKFPDRFLDRCERFEFEAGATDHANDLQALIDRVWAAEVGTDRPAPKAADLGGIVDANGQISYRRVIRALEPKIARARVETASVATIEPAKPATVKPTPEPTPAPVVRIAARTVQAAKPTRPADAIDWDEQADRYRAGWTLAEISRATGIPAETCHGRLRKLGVVFNQRKRKAS